MSSMLRTLGANQNEDPAISRCTRGPGTRDTNVVRESKGTTRDDYRRRRSYRAGPKDTMAPVFSRRGGDVRTR